MPKLRIDNFQGLDKRISEKGDFRYFEDIVNFSTNENVGEFTSRNGYLTKLDVKMSYLNKFVIFQDVDWGKDVLLGYNKDVSGSRNIWVYTRTIDTDDQFVKLGTYDYGSSTFSDVEFFANQKYVRIGTGTQSTDKALIAGYITQEMFNNSDFSNNDFYLLKQQWVQQPTQMSDGSKIFWDSTRERFYVLTVRGLEIKDADFYTERILEGVVTSYDIGPSPVAEENRIGNCCCQGDTLYACGRKQDSADYGILMWDIANDYELSSTMVTRTAATGVIHHICCDSNNIYECWQNTAGVGYITEYSTTLTGAVNRYTGNDCIYGIELDSNYVFVIDKVNAGEQLVKMVRAAPYTAYTYAHGLGSSSTVGQMYASGYSIVWSHGANVYSTPKIAFNTKTFQYTSYTGDHIIGIYYNLTNYYFTTKSGIVDKTDGTFAVTGFLPGKINFYVGNLLYPRGTFNETFFYGVSVVDHLGQESHLMRGGCHPAGLGTVLLIVNLFAESEKYSELSSPTQDPADNNSIWGMYRRIKKIKIYRAFAASNDAANPTTNYTFLKEIDINDSRWVVNNPSGTNYDYAEFTILDDVAQSEISSVTYEESSGLQEAFKPYYTNWKHAVLDGASACYGNVYTDAVYENQIIKTPAYSLDIVYQTPANISIFTQGISSGINRMVSVYGRYWVFKRDSVGLFNGLNVENVFNIGTLAADAITVRNNIVYFANNTGLYEMDSRGYRKISQQVDVFFRTADITNGIIVFYERKNQLWFNYGSYILLVYNLDTKTWDRYSFIGDNAGKGLVILYNGDIYSHNGAWIFKHDTGSNDDGANISLSLQSKKILIGGKFENAEIDSVFMEYKYSDSFPLFVKTVNENGTKSQSVTFSGMGFAPPSEGLKMEKKYISSYGESIQFSINTSVNKKLQIRAFGATTIKGDDVE